MRKLRSAPGVVCTLALLVGCGSDPGPRTADRPERRSGVSPPQSPSLADSEPSKSDPSQECIESWNTNPDPKHLREELNLSAQANGAQGGEEGVLVTRYEGEPIEDAATGSLVDPDYADVTVSPGDCLILTRADNGFALSEGSWIPIAAIPTRRFGDYIGVVEGNENAYLTHELQGGPLRTSSDVGRLTSLASGGDGVSDPPGAAPSSDTPPPDAAADECPEGTSSLGGVGGGCVDTVDP